MNKILVSLAALIILSTSGQVFGAEKAIALPDFTKGDKPAANTYEKSYSLHLRARARGIPNGTEDLTRN